jgi:hypothetical protein
VTTARGWYITFRSIQFLPCHVACQPSTTRGSVSRNSKGGDKVVQVP